MNAVNVVKEIENAPASTRLVRLEDTRTAEPSEIQLCSTGKGFEDTPIFAAQNCAYIQAVGGDILRSKCQR